MKKALLPKKIATLTVILSLSSTAIAAPGFSARNWAKISPTLPYGARHCNLVKPTHMASDLKAVLYEMKSEKNLNDKILVSLNEHNENMKKLIFAPRWISRIHKAAAFVAGAYYGAGLVASSSAAAAAETAYEAGILAYMSDLFYLGTSAYSDLFSNASYVGGGRISPNAKAALEDIFEAGRMKANPVAAMNDLKSLSAKIPGELRKKMNQYKQQQSTLVQNDHNAPGFWKSALTLNGATVKYLEDLKRENRDLLNNLRSENDFFAENIIGVSDLCTILVNAQKREAELK